MPTHIGETARKAHKIYRCQLCASLIEIGDQHHVSTLVFDGRIYAWRECMACHEADICDRVYQWAGMPDAGVGPDEAQEWAEEEIGDPDAAAYLARLRHATIEEED